MRTITATEADRNFSEILDLVESGENVLITRGNDAVAEVRPARPRTGADLEAALLSANLPRLDANVERDIADVLALVADARSDPS